MNNMNYQKMTMTPTEVFVANDFAEKVAKNIDEKDFMDDRNVRRTLQKVKEDNFKGKLAEMYIVNVLGYNGDIAKIDINIYEKGIGDDFDVTSNGKSIDVKASSPRAKWLMVEDKKITLWEKNGVPDVVCMVAVSGETCTYLFGCTYKVFQKKAQYLKRGEKIPNTNTMLKANNYAIHMDNCSDSIIRLMSFIKEARSVIQREN